MTPERVARDNMFIFVFGGAMPEGSELTEIVVDGPAATQQRDASQERARSWNFIPRELKKEQLRECTPRYRTYTLASTDQSNGSSDSGSKTFQVLSLPKSSEAQDCLTKSIHEGQ